MKSLFIAIMAATTLTVVACNNETKTAEQKPAEKTANGSTASDKDIKTVSATYKDVNPAIAASLKEVTQHYLHIKNALATDNSQEAASGGEAMLSAMKKLDKSLLTPDQKKLYEENEEDLLEHAEHMGHNAGKIDHQREHFAMMSEEVYDLTKAFGGGTTLYHDHCPMYNENKGAMWLSETAEIKNPYMGSKMPKCGIVKEKLD